MKLLISLLMLPVLAIAAVPAGSLDPAQRDKLRYWLEEHFNELDLLIRNHRSEVKDLERQKRDLAGLKVLERIPLEKRVPELKRELSETARAHGLKIRGFKELELSKTLPVPARIYSDQAFRMSPRQIAQELRFSLEVGGDAAKLDSWIASWQTEQLRLVELVKKKKTAPGRFRLEARAFRFRPIEFPKVEIRDPVHLLPGWARKDPASFARAEPLLWKFVTQSRELAPKALPLYEERRAMLLNSARMEFFLSKALPRQAHTH